MLSTSLLARASDEGGDGRGCCERGSDEDSSDKSDSEAEPEATAFGMGLGTTTTRETDASREAPEALQDASTEVQGQDEELVEAEAGGEVKHEAQEKESSDEFEEDADDDIDNY